MKWRLAGGKLPNEGRVEVFHNGVWGSICTVSWDLNDANVVCRSMGLPAATYALGYNNGFQGSYSSNIKSWLTNLHCTGHELSLIDCPHPGLGNIPSWCSYYRYQAAVVCGHPPGTFHPHSPTYTAQQICKFSKLLDILRPPLAINLNHILGEN